MWQSQQNQPQQNGQQNNTNNNPQPATGTTEYFEQANVSFTHDPKWSFSEAGLTETFAGHPDKKLVTLSMPYQGSGAAQSKYTITFQVDSVQPDAEPTLTTFDNLGSVQLGTQTLHILRAHYDAEQIGQSLDKIVTSGCTDKLCPVELDGTNLYFEVSAGKGVQAPEALDDAVVPEITTILKTLKLGKA